LLIWGRPEHLKCIQVNAGFKAKVLVAWLRTLAAGKSKVSRINKEA